MKVKRTVLVTIALAMTVALSGCGEKAPDMTEEEYAQVVEFAVGLLMKYSNNEQEKLTFVDAKEVKKEREKEAKLAAQAEEKLKEEKPKEEKKPEPAYVEKGEEQSPADEKETEAIAEATEDESTEAVSEATNLIADAKEEEEKETLAAGSDAASTEATPEPETTEKPSGDGITLSSDETQEIAKDLFLSYQGYSISRTYPESSKSYVVNADKGKKLLVLRFDLYNASGSTKSVNMINQNLLFQILLNGNNLGYSSVTFLPNDLSSFIGQIESKAHESLVVLTQISESEAKSVETLGMIVTMNGEKQEVKLE